MVSVFIPSVPYDGGELFSSLVKLLIQLLDGVKIVRCVEQLLKDPIAVGDRREPLAADRSILIDVADLALPYAFEFFDRPGERSDVTPRLESIDHAFQTAYAGLGGGPQAIDLDGHLV